MRKTNIKLNTEYFNKKLFYIIILYLVFTILLIFILFGTRILTKNYLSEAQQYSEEINKIKESLNNNNLDDYENAEKTIDKVNSIANKGLIISYALFPLSILLLFVLFQISYWKLKTNSKLIDIILIIIIEISLIFILLYNLLSYVDYKFFNGVEKSFLFSLIFLILLLGFNYFSIVHLARKNKLINRIEFGFNNLNKFLFLYFILFILNIIYSILIFLIFAFSFVGYSIIIPSIFIVFIILLIVYTKNILIDRIHNFKI